MLKKALIGAGLLALAAGGVATAATLSKITLHPGQCAKLGSAKVCAARAAIRTLTVSSPPQTLTQTVTLPAQTVTQVLTQTVVQTVATPVVNVPAPTPTTTQPTGGSPVTVNLSGNGDATEAPFTTSVGETLSWTVADTCGFGISIWDWGPFPIVNLAESTTSSGSTYLAAGTHVIQVIACGDWTIHVS